MVKVEMEVSQKEIDSQKGMDQILYLIRKDYQE